MEPGLQPRSMEPGLQDFILYDASILILLYKEPGAPSGIPKLTLGRVGGV